MVSRPRFTTQEDKMRTSTSGQSSSRFTTEGYQEDGLDLFLSYPITFACASFVGALICVLPLYLFDAVEGLLYLTFQVENLLSGFLGRLYGTVWKSVIDAFPDSYSTVRKLRNYSFLFNPVFLFFLPPVYAGLHYMALKPEKPRIRDIFKGFRRYGSILVLWWSLYLIPLLMLFITWKSILVAPLFSAIALLAFPIFIDEQKTVASAYGAAIKAIFTFTWHDWQGSLKKFGFWWPYGLLAPIVAHVGIWVLGIGVFFTVPFVVCFQVSTYRDVFEPDTPRDTSEPNEPFQQEVLEPWQEYPFNIKARYIEPLSRIRDRHYQIIGQIRSANDSIKPLLEDSIESINNVCTKAVHLSQHLQQIGDYLETTDRRTLHDEKIEIMRRQLEEPPNTAISAQYEEALRNLEEQIGNQRRLEELREQIDAQLVTIRTSLGNTHAKIMRIRATEISDTRLESNDVSTDLQDLQIETDALLESLGERAETA